MAWIEPRFSARDVDRAGKILVRYDAGLSNISEVGTVVDIVNNWRASHSFPLNTLQNGLRAKCAKVDPGIIVAQRIKRLSSIRHKLDRFPTMNLSRMQDIAGCRAVVSSIGDVHELVSLHTKSGMKHKLDRSDDYITQPKESGYRGHHLVYRYNSDRRETYNGLKIEVQIRTTMQHAWATAVETVGAFLQQSLKSSLGEADWLRFFALMGTAHALVESAPPVPNTPSDLRLLHNELRELVQQLDVVNRLRYYGELINAVEHSTLDAHYYLLKLDSATGNVTIWGYKANDLIRASEHYEQLESETVDIESTDAVLVSVATLSALRRAYPNYFADTEAFLITVQDIL
ncbi:MAG: RelA/SpoT domain-containing protein [Armatimonadetes bacterium]|nr:RelA/SpoT domain-containing protein [Armatimonadota bacterium]